MPRVSPPPRLALPVPPLGLCHTQDILVKINECNSKLDSKRVEIEQLLARRAAVSTEFEATVPDAELFKEQLAKIFNRCVQMVQSGTRGQCCFHDV